MPATPNGLPYPAPTAPVASGASDIQALAQAIDPRHGSFSLTPPANPVDGQIWRMQGSLADGIVWTFRYNVASPSPYKWEFVGGAVWTVALASTFTIGAANTWQNLGPSTIPIARTGEYLFSAFAIVTPASAPVTPYLGIYNGAAASTIAAASQTVGGASWAASLAIVNSKSSQVAGSNIGLSGYGPLGTTYGAGASWSVVPVRIQ